MGVNYRSWFSLNILRRKKAEEVAVLRALRLTCHKIHTVALLSSALARNKWLNDPLLHVCI